MGLKNHLKYNNLIFYSMALAKFREDIVDDYSDKNPVGYQVIKPVISTSSDEKILPLIDCCYCGKGFADFDELQTHILKTHKTTSPFIEIDSRIADEITIVSYIPENFRFYNNGDETLDVEIQFNNSPLSLLQINKQSTISLLPKRKIKQGLYNIRVIQFNKEYYIYINQIPDFDSHGLDLKVNELSDKFYQFSRQSALDDNNWNTFWREFTELCRGTGNMLEEKYLSGFFEYVYGLYLEDIKIDQCHGEHYESAFGYLRIFNTKLAKIILRALSFKMNYFENLTKCNPASFFYPASQFYLQDFDILKEKIESGEYELADEEELLKDSSTLIDLKHSLLIKGIKYYLRKEFNQISNIREQIEGLIRKDDEEDISFMNKYKLLLARMARYENKNKEAYKYYSEIIDTGLIGKEAKEYLINGK